MERAIETRKLVCLSSPAFATFDADLAAVPPVEINTQSADCRLCSARLRKSSAIRRLDNGHTSTNFGEVVIQTSNKIQLQSRTLADAARQTVLCYVHSLRINHVDVV